MGKVLKVTATNTQKVRLLVFLGIVMGHILSSSLSVYTNCGKKTYDYYKIKSKGNNYGKIVVQGGDNLVGSVTIEGVKECSLCPCWQRLF